MEPDHRGVSLRAYKLIDLPESAFPHYIVQYFDDTVLMDESERHSKMEDAVASARSTWDDEQFEAECGGEPRYDEVLVLRQQDAGESWPVWMNGHPVNGCE